MLVGEVLQLSAVKSTEVVSSGERVFLSCTFSNRANSVGILRGLANTRLGISNDDGSLDRGSYSFSSDPVVFVSLFGFVGVIVVLMVRALGGGGIVSSLQYLSTGSSHRQEVLSLSSSE